MASIRIPGPPEAGPAAEPWPADEHTIRVDEMFARRLDTEFAAGVRGLLHDPETGLSSLGGEAALEAIAGVYPALEELKAKTLDQALGPRQRSILAPLVETRLDGAAGAIGRLAERATVEVDDASVADRIAGLRQDAAASWHDPAWLRKLGRAAVTELRYQGERRGWDAAEIDARARAGLSDLYADAVEAAIGKDVEGAAGLLAHAREAIDPARRETIDHRLARAREDGFLREVDAALASLPLDPTAAPTVERFSARVSELTPHDATDEVRARLDELASHAQRRAERQWTRRQAEAGIAALDWLKRNPDGSWLGLSPDLRDWLAPDQMRGLEALLIEGRLRTDPDLFERLDRQMVYEPDGFAALDLDRHRLSLDDQDHARFAGAQKAIAEGTVDPAVARYRQARVAIDRQLKATEGVSSNGEYVGHVVGAEASRPLTDDTADPFNLFPANPAASRGQIATSGWFHQIDARDNYRQGLVAEQSVLEEIRKRLPKSGTAEHIRLYVEGGPRYMVGDIVLNPTGTSLVILEVKSGMAELTPMQVKVLAEAVKSGNIHFTNTEAAEKLKTDKFKIEANRTFAAQGILPQVYIIDGNQEAIRRQMIKAGLEVVPRMVGRHRVLSIKARSM